MGCFFLFVLVFWGKQREQFIRESDVTAVITKNVNVIHIDDIVIYLELKNEHIERLEQNTKKLKIKIVFSPIWKGLIF